MKSNLVIKSLVAASLLGAAVVSQADSFSVLEQGTFSTPVPLTVSSTFSTIAQLAPSTLTEAVTGGTFTLTEAAAPTPAGVAVTGTLVVYGTTVADSLTFNFAGSVYSGATNSLAASATLVSLSGTGAYSIYTSGTGNLAFQLININSDRHVSSGEISGTLNAVPEPASFAVLGLGLAGILLRRRS